MTATTSENQALANGLAALTFIGGVIDKLLADFPADKATHQPYPGANHVAWNIGHLAWADDYFGSQFSGQPRQTPEAWDALFGMGSEPVDDPSKYPSLAELNEARTKCRAALMDWFKGLGEEKLAEAMPEEMQNFAPTYGALMSSIAAHDGMHAGQITALRKAIGLERVMG